MKTFFYFLFRFHFILSDYACLCCICCLCLYLSFALITKSFLLSHCFLDSLHHSPIFVGSSCLFRFPLCLSPPLLLHSFSTTLSTNVVAAYENNRHQEFQVIYCQLFHSLSSTSFKQRRLIILTHAININNSP